jgi:hypothetical protein
MPFVASRPSVVVNTHVSSPYGRSYDVSPDGKFLLIIPAASGVSESAPVNIVVNWAEELKRLRSK